MLRLDAGVASEEVCAVPSFRVHLVASDKALAFADLIQREHETRQKTGAVHLRSDDCST